MRTNPNDPHHTYNPQARLNNQATNHSWNNTPNNHGVSEVPCNSTPVTAKEALLGHPKEEGKSNCPQYFTLLIKGLGTVISMGAGFVTTLNAVIANKEETTTPSPYSTTPHPSQTTPSPQFDLVNSVVIPASCYAVGVSLALITFNHLIKCSKTHRPSTQVDGVTNHAYLENNTNRS